MNNRLTICLIGVLVVVLLAMTGSAYAQGVTTAAMNGVIKSKTGEPLPGVNVVAVHDPSGTVFGTTTRENGRFNLPSLRVGGPYTVTASLVGYKKETRTGIILRLSENLDLNMTLSEEAVQAGEVVVVGERASIFNASHAGATTNVDRTAIDKLPTISRSFQDFFKLSPYYEPSTATGTVGNVLGRNSKYSNIQIDGTNFNDLMGLGSTGAPAGQSNVTPISLDAIDEFQVSVSPFDVRQAGFTAAGINVITRSGTNDYTGSVFFFGRNQGLAGLNPDPTGVNKSKLANFTDYQLGGRAGGPIIQNKLFYFGNAEITRFKQPFTRTFGTQQLGTNQYPANADSLQMLVDYLKSKYNYDAGSFTNIGYNRESDKLMLRFDYNIDDANKLTARWNYLRSTEDNSPSRGRSVTDIYFDNGKYKLDNHTNSIAVLLNSTFGNSASNEFTLGYVRQKDVPVYYGTPFPSLYIATYGTNTAYKGAMDLVLGAEEFRHFNLLNQGSFEIQDNYTLYLPDHVVTVGAKIDLLTFENLFIPDGFGEYAYRSIYDFINDRPAGGNPANSSTYSYRYSATSNPQQEANWTANQYGVYAQDEWTVNPTLKLIAGLRVDIPTYGDHPNHNAAIDADFGYQTDSPPKTSLAFSPRLGFNWAVDEERSAQVRGGLGIFYGHFPYVWVSNQYSNTGVDFYTVTTFPGHFIADPNAQPRSAAGLPSAEVDLTDPNFKAPSIFRWQLGGDYKLPFGLVATVEGIFSTTINDVYYKNINLKGLQNNDRYGPALTPGGKIVGENRAVWGILDSATASRYTTQWVDAARFSPGVFLVTNTSQGSNANVTVQVQRNVLQGLNGTLAYTWGISKDVNSGNSTQAASGWRFNPTQGDPNNPTLTYSQWDRRHRILLGASYVEEWAPGFKGTVALFYNIQSGRPFSYMVSGDVNGDGRSDNDLAYIPRDANDIILVNSSNVPLAKSDPAYALMMSYINADPYLSEHKGQISERSGPREPWAHSIDLRLAQEIPTVGTQRIEITIDILNVLNLLNSNWGWIRNTGVNQTVNLFTFKGLDKTPANYGKAHYQWSGLPVDNNGHASPFQPDNILSRYQVQFGIRYTL